MKELFDKLNIKTNNLKLYEAAFEHSSYFNERRINSDYERLEFLGDAVLELIISEYLYLNYNLVEGEMTKVRANYVCENALFQYASKLNLNNYVKLGKGELKSGGKYKKAIVADIFEALIAALYLDQGYSFTKEFVLGAIVPYIENRTDFLGDYKSRLQEAVQTDKRSVTYHLKEETGPAHDKKFHMEVIIDDINYGEGWGSSKKEAEQEAAKEALNKLVK